jgi:hypothetical protein
VAAFLSAEWLATLNDTLSAAGPVPLDSSPSDFRVVFEFTDAPTSSPHALTFTINAEGASADAGDHLAANTVIRLSFKDAEGLTNGTLDSASALREGRLKVRGDIHALVPLLTWLLGAK